MSTPHEHKRGMRLQLARYVLGLCMALIWGLSEGQTVTTYDASGSFTVPPGVTSVTVECWGGGGRGGSRTSNGRGGGGGGGAYARSVLTVVPGNSYTVTVGAGSNSNTSPGGDSWFSTAGTILAKGGQSAASNSTTGAAGGSSAASIGTVKFDGGNGDDAPASTGAGGGSSAGTAANGANGSGQNGGTAPAGGGDGGDGGNAGFLVGAGVAGTAPGGGGGGAERSALSGNQNGGNGASGRVVVTYVYNYANGTCMPAASYNAIPDNGCAGSNALLLTIPISGLPATLGTAPGNARLVSVSLVASHTYNGDMEISLIAPGGSTRSLVTDRFGNGDNLGNPATCPNSLLTLVDGGTALSNSNTSNVTGNYAPEQTLAGFSGNPNGNWVLRVCDDANLDLGNVRYVNLTFCSVPQVTGTSTNSPVCSTTDVTLAATATGNPAVAYSWAGTGTFSPNNTSASVTVAGAASGNYTVTVTNSCGSTNAVIPVVVNPLPTVNCGTYGPACANAPDILLGGSPSGGTWSGTGVTGNNFDPDAGTQTVTYNYTDGNNCSNSCQTTITVNPVPVVSCPGNSSVCIDAAAFPLDNTGESPTGGTYTGTGVTANTFDPAAAGAGTHTITYSYTDGNSCTGTCTFDITVNALPVMTCPSNSSVCIDAAAFSLDNTGENPTGGTYTGTGVTANTFDPAAAGVGTHTITYSYTDGNTCTNTCTFDITVNDLPVVTCPADITDACTADAPLTLAGTGENPTGGTFSGPGVSGGIFDAATAGAGTHTITYSYTDGNSCTSTCTFDITVAQATAWYSDLGDGDGLGDPNDMVMACVAPVGYVADNTDLCPVVTGTVGSACDDNNCYTSGDVLDGDCICAGTPVPCDNWTLTINAGTNGGEISWVIQEDGGPCVLQSGSGYASNQEHNVNICVPQGNCFKLTVNDAGGNGIQGGDWKLVDNNGRRILDNVGNGSCFASTSTHAEAFCNEPTSAQTVIAGHCDRENWIITNTIIASEDPAVSAQWGIGDQTDDGYQFWFFSPCGSYNRKMFRNHATSGGQGPANALRASKLALATMVSNPLPVGELLNVRVRSRVNGVNGDWGPACRFRLDPNFCTLTKLNSTVSSPNYSCGVSGKVVGASGNNGKIWADVVTSGGNPATHYRFQFSVPGEGYLRNVVSTNAACLLGIWQTSPLLCGTYTYDVRVQASFDGGATYCPFGDVCTVTITNNQPTPFCTTPAAAMAEQGHTRMDNFDGGDFAMYPNPNRGDQLFLNMSGIDEEVSIVTMDIFDLFGKRAMSATLPVQDGSLNTALELAPEMAAGMYLVTLTAGERTRTERLVIQR